MQVNLLKANKYQFKKEEKITPRYLEYQLTHNQVKRNLEMEVLIMEQLQVSVEREQHKYRNLKKLKLQIAGILLMENLDKVYKT